MAKVTYIESNGTQRVVEVEAGLSVMEGAVKNSVPGIVAICAGACACATCHVYVDAAWESRTGVRTEVEESMLEMADEVRPNSRLACQIKITAELDGLVVHTPDIDY
jgi:ferredoxin, 2Fe-2S